MNIYLVFLPSTCRFYSNRYFSFVIITSNINLDINIESSDLHIRCLALYLRGMTSITLSPSRRNSRAVKRDVNAALPHCQWPRIRVGEQAGKWPPNVEPTNDLRQQRAPFSASKSSRVRITPLQQCDDFLRLAARASPDLLHYIHIY